MPGVDRPLSEPKNYRGINPKPADFEEFWRRALEELDGTNPEPELLPVDPLGSRKVETFDLRFTGVGGARVYAKYLRPSEQKKPSPSLLLFHNYNGNSGNWNDKLPYVLEGFSVAAMDCRGQGGRSSDPGGVSGSTQHGHIVRGLADGPDKLLFRQIFLDAVQLARVTASFSETSEVYCMGSSQGGGLAIACAALEPLIKRCVALYPFLSDYQRVWEMDLAKDSYSDLTAYLRTFDPHHETGLFETLGYIDVHHLASRVQAKVLMALTLMDRVCPPSTQFAVYNNLPGDKEAVIYRDFGHENLPGFHDRAFRFLIETI